VKRRCAFSANITGRTRAKSWKNHQRLQPGHSGAAAGVTAKSIENVIANDNDFSGMGLKAADIFDLSFLERLEEGENDDGAINSFFTLSVLSPPRQ